MGPFDNDISPINRSDLASSPFSFFDMSIDKLGRESPTVTGTATVSNRTVGTYIFKLPSTHLTGLQLGRIAVRLTQDKSSIAHFRYPVRKPRTLIVAAPPVLFGSSVVPSH